MAERGPAGSCEALAALYGAPESAVCPPRPPAAPNLLYHVTAAPNAELIQRDGLQPGLPMHQGGLAQATAEAALAGEEPDFDFGETPEDVRTREAFNELLKDAARQRPDYNQLPLHDEAIFAWSDRAIAFEVARRERKATGEPTRIVVIDPTAATGTWWSGSFDLSSDLYTSCAYNLDECEACSGLFGPPPEQEEGEATCSELDEIARRYYADLRPWDGKPDPDREIFCGCEVPPAGIVRIERP